MLKDMFEIQLKVIAFYFKSFLSTFTYVTLVRDKLRGCTFPLAREKQKSKCPVKSNLTISKDLLKNPQWAQTLSEQIDLK